MIFVGQMAIKKNSKKYISKHDKYVDYRVSIISNYLTSIDNTNRLNCGYVIQHLLGDTVLSLDLKIVDYVFDAIESLKKLVKTWDILEDGDIVGYIYQGIQSTDDKKNKGQFFTPADIVSEMVESSLVDFENLEKCKIVDPACGSGQFLIETFKYLFLRYKGEGKNSDESIDLIINKNLHGIDIDPIAVDIAQYNLSVLSGYKKDKIKIQRKDYLLRDDLNYIDSLLTFKSFDLVIGNPPWGSKLNNTEKKYYRKSYHSIKSGINTFTLFIERSFDFVKDGGVVSYLIPEAFLNVKAHKNSREFVLDSSMVEKISTHGERFKGVFAPSVSVQLRSESDHVKKRKNIVSIDLFSGDNTNTLVPQDSFHRNYDSIFNINYSRKVVDIVDTMNSKRSQYLHNSKFFLGIVTGDNTKHISSVQTDEYPDPILVGKDLSQYDVNFSENYFKFNPSLLQQVAPQELYKSPDKILYKFIGKRLTFAIDDSGYYSLNNVNGFVPKLYDVNSEAALSILNSKVMQYYYEKNFFTLKVLKGNLERLPIVNMDLEVQKMLTRLVSDLDTTDIIKYNNLRENVEDIIFHQYGINDRDAYMINDQIK